MTRRSRGYTLGWTVTGSCASLDGVRRTEAEAVLRSGKARVRHRDMRRALPRVERHDPRAGLCLRLHYGVNKVYGFRFGYEGLVRRIGHEPLALTPESVHRIHESGGTILGSSRATRTRGNGRVPEGPRGRDLFAIGGDGTLRGAQKIGEEAARRGMKLGVIGVPKTIDNDISFVQRTFGFETAVSEARHVTNAANAEAEAARNGIGLVKLMGRDSGFIAAYSALVNNHVNFCLVPEVPFTLDTFLSALQERLERRSHAVIVVAEGAGQDLMAKSQERDASGNVKYGDIGAFSARDPRPFQADRHGDHPQVHRSQLHDQERASDGGRFGLLPAPRAECGSRGPQRAHEHGRQLLESPVHPRTDFPCRVGAQEDRSAGGTLEQRGHIDRAAVGHAVRVWVSGMVYFGVSRGATVCGSRTTPYYLFCHSRLRDLLTLRFKRDAAWIGAAAHSGIERVDCGDLVAGELKVKDRSSRRCERARSTSELRNGPPADATGASPARPTCHVGARSLLASGRRTCASHHRGRT